jgi:hypothetical protein
MSIRIGVNGELHDEFAVLNVFGDFWSNVELLHGAYEGFGAVNDILVDGMPVKAQFVDTVAVLVDDLHLLDNSRLAALTRTFAHNGSVDDVDRKASGRTYLATRSCTRAVASSSLLQGLDQWPDSFSSDLRRPLPLNSCSYPW